MDPATITHLVINVGLAAAMAVFFVWRDAQRLTKMEEFQRDTLVRLVVDATQAATATAQAMHELTAELKNHNATLANHVNDHAENTGD